MSTSKHDPCRMLLLLTELGLKSDMALDLLNLYGIELEDKHLKYLQAPIVLASKNYIYYAPPPPKWAIDAIKTERVTKVLNEIDRNIIGREATTAEVMVYLYSLVNSSNRVPINYAHIYIWSTIETISRHQDKDKEELWRQAEPRISFYQIRTYYNHLASYLRDATLNR